MTDVQRRTALGTHRGYTTIEVVREGSVDWLTLNRPDRLNALTGVMVSELWDYFNALHADFACRVVVLRGAGKGFCAGLDLAWFARAGESMPQGDTQQGPGPSFPDLILKMRSCPQPIISLIHGAACGGGFNFALASDIRIAGESARMQVTYVKLGLSGCELGTSFFLPRLVGMSIASELMMTGRFLRAERALSIGLVSAVVADEKLGDAARELLVDLLATSPVGLRRTKQVLGSASEIGDLAAVIAMEERTQLACMEEPAFKEAIASFISGSTARA